LNTEVLTYFIAFISRANDAIAPLLDEESSTATATITERIERFVNEMNFAEVGCLEVRIGRALNYAERLKRGDCKSFDDVLEEWDAYDPESEGTSDATDDFVALESLKRFFLDKGQSIIIDSDEPRPLTLGALLEYAIQCSFIVTDAIKPRPLDELVDFWLDTILDDALEQGDIIALHRHFEPLYGSRVIVNGEEKPLTWSLVFKYVHFNKRHLPDNAHSVKWETYEEDNVIYFMRGYEDRETAERSLLYFKAILPETLADESQKIKVSQKKCSYYKDVPCKSHITGRTSMQTHSMYKELHVNSIPLGLFNAFYNERHESSHYDASTVSLVKTIGHGNSFGDIRSFARGVMPLADDERQRLRPRYYKGRFKSNLSHIREADKAVSSFPEEDKALFSPYQSVRATSLANSTPLFSKHRVDTDAEAIVGVNMPLTHSRIGRVCAGNMGSYFSPWADDDGAYQPVEINWHILLNHVRLGHTRRGKHYANHEVLARLRWVEDEGALKRCQVIIGSDNLQARMLAMEYARILKARLALKHEEEGLLPLADDYEIPIQFYLPGHDSHGELYTRDEQLEDIERMKKALTCDEERKNYFSLKHYAIALADDDPVARLFDHHEDGKRFFDILFKDDSFVLESMLEKAQATNPVGLQAALYENFPADASEQHLALWLYLHRQNKDSLWRYFAEMDLNIDYECIRIGKELANIIHTKNLSHARLERVENILKDLKDAGGIASNSSWLNRNVPGCSATLLEEAFAAFDEENKSRVRIPRFRLLIKLIEGGASLYPAEGDDTKNSMSIIAKRWKTLLVHHSFCKKPLVLN